MSDAQPTREGMERTNGVVSAGQDGHPEVDAASSTKESLQDGIPEEILRQMQEGFGEFVASYQAAVAEDRKRKDWAIGIGMVAAGIPALILSGFVPGAQVLPAWFWVGVAAIGSAIAGTVGTRFVVRGAIAGMIAGLGAMAGVWLYTVMRVELTGSTTFLNLELLIGWFLGGAPGGILYVVWADSSSKGVL